MTFISLPNVLSSTFNVALVALPPLQLRSKVAPRTRAPLIDPDGHAVGSAGSIVIGKGVLRLGTSGDCTRAFCTDTNVSHNACVETTGRIYHDGARISEVCVNLENGIGI
jgi:hypothetical protein